MLTAILERLSGVGISNVQSKTFQRVAFAIIIAPLLIVSVYNYIKTYNDLTEVTLLRREAIARLAASTLEEKLRAITDVGVSLASGVQFRQLVSEQKWDEAISVLDRVPANFSFIDRVVLTDPSGILRADTPAAPDLRGNDLSYRGWYKAVVQTSKPYISNVYKRTAEPRFNVIGVAVPIQAEAERLVGILLLQIGLDSLFEWAKYMEGDSPGSIYFVDAAGQVAGHPAIPPQGPIVDYASVPAVQKALSGERAVGILYNPLDSQHQVAAYAPVAPARWAVVVQESTRTAFAARDENLQRLLVIYGITFLLNCGLAYLILRILSRLKQAEAANSLLASIVKFSDDAIFGETLDGTIISWNAGAQRIYGYSATEITGQSASILIPSERAHELKEILTWVRQGQGVQQYETMRKTKDGRRIDVSLTVCPIKDANDEVTEVSIIARDITEQKQSVQTIRQLNEDLNRRAAELEAANKELEAFSYSVSHDLRAPLRAIDGFSQALLEDYSDKLDADGKDYLNRVRAGSQQMAQLIDDMLNLSRITRGEIKRENVDLTAAAHAVAKDLQRSELGRQVDFVIAEGTGASGDARLLRVVLENLLGNAWKFTEKTAAARIEFGKTQENGASVFFVRDNGAGFDMAYADKLFGAFQRLHAATEFKGTGIGLATVQRIIHRHGGRIWAEGKVNHGATFYFSLSHGDLLDGEQDHSTGGR